MRWNPVVKQILGWPASRPAFSTCRRSPEKFKPGGVQDEREGLEEREAISTL